MAEYLSLIITVALFSGILNAFIDEKGVGKVSRTVTSIVLLACIIIPIMKTLTFFRDNLSLPVIKEESAHINDIKESDTLLYRKWLAKVTAEDVSAEIKNCVKKYTGLDVEVECPWQVVEDSVVFGTIKVYTESDARYYEKIKNCIKLHYSLDAECIAVDK